MAHTPTSGDSRSPGSPPPDRIRRNVACISCRDSKVRCRAGTVQGQPCQRCAKLQVSCVYDKSHKRITRRSKLELLEQELKTIKEAVNPPPQPADAAWSPPVPKANVPAFPESSERTSGSVASLLNSEPPPPPPPACPPTWPASKPGPVNARFEKLGQTKSQVLKDRIISGEDIDWYFDKYLRCFHPYLPILRKKDPDECFQSCPTLFWCIIYVSCRRYCKEEYIFTTLVEQLGRDIWALVANPAMDLESIHAILIMTTWPLPNIRFVTDPSPTLASVALNACSLLGLYTGRGSNPTFCVGSRQQVAFSDHDACTTWIMCCIIVQRIAVTAGRPPPFLQHNDGVCKRAMEQSLASEIMTIFDLQKFSNRLHTSMAAQVATHGGVYEATIRTWEDELELLKPVVARKESDFSRFMLLAAQLEVQLYYFCSPPGMSQPSLSINTLRAYKTAQAVISAGLALESHSQFLTHGPHWVFRLIIDATCILISTLHSQGAPPGLSPAEADAVVRQAHSTTHRCSVREGDLPARSSIIFETFWSTRHLVPKTEVPVGAWPERLGAAVTFWCLGRFRESLQEAKKSSDGAKKGLEAFKLNYPLLQVNNSTSNNLGPAAGRNYDVWQDVDWSLLLDDDFGWGGDANMMFGGT